MRRDAILLNMKTTTARNPKPQRFTEKTSGGFDRIDRDAGVIYGVRVLGLDSKNGRRYLREAVQAAAPLYEGARVYLDHQEKGERAVRARWGRLVNVREAEDGGLRADLEYLKEHPLTGAILEAAERFEDIGLSHDSLGRSRMQEGERVVYEIVEVNSVDLVEKPATTSNLWESHAVKRKFLELLKEHSAAVPAAKVLAGRLQEMMDGGSPEVMKQLDEAEVDAPEESAPADDQVKTGLRQAMLAILDNDDDSATTIQKLKVLLAAQDKMGAAPAAPAGDEPDMSAMEEATKKVCEAVERMESRLRILETTRLPSKTEEFQKLLESANRDATPERLRLLESAPEADRDALVKSWPARAQRPATSPPKYSSAAATSDLPQPYLEARKSIRALSKTEKV